MDNKPLKLTLAIATLAICGAAISSGAAPLELASSQVAPVLVTPVQVSPAQVSPAQPNYEAAIVVPPTTAPPSGSESALQLLEPGTYDWHPELSPAGDVLVVVSLPQQQLHVYRGGVRIGRSTISSGRAGHETTTGVFTILQKKVKHRSSLYNDAPMPYMQRLTWDGIALHAGRLPGYPASHGCVRLPLEFSKLLYGATDHDTVVIVADYNTFPEDVVAPGDSVTAGMLAAVASESERSLAGSKAADTASAPAFAASGAP
ncbi:MAG: L,D-transpeptidase family protein [Luteimonas sp.]